MDAQLGPARPATRTLVRTAARWNRLPSTSYAIYIERDRVDEHWTWPRVGEGQRVNVAGISEERR